MNKQNEEGSRMKTITLVNSMSVAGWLAGFALIGMLALPIPLQAQEKGATKLLKLNAVKTVADAKAMRAGDTVVTRCPKCKDSWVTIMRTPAKTGAKPEEERFVRHECPSCSTRIITEGLGKQAKNVVKHVCTQSGNEDANCCVIR